MTLDLNKRQVGLAETEPQRLNVLVSGASFAWLATAFWMNRLGYTVTVVEIGKGLKMGGSPVDIKEGTVDIVKRMVQGRRRRQRRCNQPVAPDRAMGDESVACIAPQ